MPGRPKKNRVKAMDMKNNLQVSMVGRQITCSNCYEKGHNREIVIRGGGRGYRVGRGDASGGRGKASSGIGEASGGIIKASGGRGQARGGRARGIGGRSGRARGRGGRGQGRGGRGRGRGGTKMLVDEQEMSEDEIRKNMKHEYIEHVLIEEEEKRIAAEKANQEEFDRRIVRLTLRRGNGATVEPIISADPSVAANETTPKGKTIESNAAEPPNVKKQGKVRKVAEPSEAEPPFRIYNKNRGRSERIFNQKMKKTGFGPNGEGSTADKVHFICKEMPFSLGINIAYISFNEFSKNDPYHLRRFMGPHWTWDSIVSKEKFGNNTGVGSWFSVVKLACTSFVCEDQIVWISIEGLPLKGWSRNTFVKVALK
ncbi:hypothetical protein Tco_0173373 [Tanacetum coccineum]